MTDKAISSYLLRFGFSRRHINAKKKDFPQEVWDLVSSWLEKKESIYIVGCCGCGKTHLASALSREYVSLEIPKIEKMEPDIERKWVGVQYISIPDMFHELRASFHDKTNTTAIIDRYMKHPNIVIDDIGAETTLDWTINSLHTIIDYRYRNLMQTMIISNLSLKELAHKVGDRIASRVSEMCRVVELQGEDRRIK